MSVLGIHCCLMLVPGKAAVVSVLSLDTNLRCLLPFVESTGWFADITLRWLLLVTSGTSRTLRAGLKLLNRFFKIVPL